MTFTVKEGQISNTFPNSQSHTRQENMSSNAFLNVWFKIFEIFADLNEFADLKKFQGKLLTFFLQKQNGQGEYALRVEKFNSEALVNQLDLKEA